jgi:hypothetical protein
MRKHRSLLILFVLLGFSVSLGFPAEDILDSVYDESEALPYESAPLFSTVVQQASARIAQAKLSCHSLLRFDSLPKRCTRRREDNARLHCVPASLTIINHSLRC